MVSAGRMIIQVAREGARDAVFDVPAQIKDNAPLDPEVTGAVGKAGTPAAARGPDIAVTLGSDPNVTAKGRVREVSPRADPVTGTFAVRVRLIDPPAGDAPGQHRHRAHAARRRQRHRDSRHGAVRADGKTAVWVFDAKTGTVSLRHIAVRASDAATVQVASGLNPGDVVVTAGVQALRPGQKVRLLETPAVIGPNLSEWALSKRSLVVFLMIVAVIAGTLSFTRLGRGEDPAFTFRTMVVAAGWPGATVEETLEAGDRAAGTHAAGDRPPRPRAQLHHGRPDDDLRRPEAVDAARRGGRRLVPGAQEHRRHAPDAAAGRRRAVLQRRLRQHLRHHLRLHRRRLHLPRTARLCRSGALAPAAGARCLEDRGAGRAGRADLHRVLDRAPGRPAPEPVDHPGHAAGAEPGAPVGHDADRAGARVPARHRRLRLPRATSRR